MQKYSQIFSSISNIISEEKPKNENKEKENKTKTEFKKISKQFSTLLFNQKLPENIFESDIENKNNEKDIIEEDNILLSNNININNDLVESKEKDIINKEDINNLIEKY